VNGDHRARTWCVETGDGQLLNVNLTREHATAIEARGKNGWWTVREMTAEEAWRFHPYRTGLASWPAELLVERYRQEPEHRDVIRAEFERRWSGREQLLLLDEIDHAGPRGCSPSNPARVSRCDTINSTTERRHGLPSSASTSS